MAKCQLSSDTDEFIFRPLTYFKSKNQSSLRKADCPISYSTTRDNVLKLIEKIGLNAKDLDFTVYDLAELTRQRTWVSRIVFLRDTEDGSPRASKMVT